MVRFMRDNDAFSWYMEADPVLRSTVVAVAWLDRSPEWELLRSRVDRASRMIPIFRQRVADVPARLGPPVWVPDEGFDLDWHLSRIDSPWPHDDATVIDFACRQAETGFDRARPLWQFTLIENLTDGRAAVVMKLHHSLTDGVGGMQLALMLFDANRTAEPAPSPVPIATGRAAAGRGGAERAATGGDFTMVTEQVKWRLRRTAGRAGWVARNAVPATLRALLRPDRAARRAVIDVRSVARTVAPVITTMSPVMTGRSLNRHLDVIAIPLDDLKRSAAAVGGSVNDGFLAGLTGGLRRYHDKHGRPVRELRVTMPISIRTPEDEPGGNRITLMRFPLPVAEEDPAARIRAIERRCREARHEPSVSMTDSIAGVLNLLPPAAVGGMLRHVDFVASDVPGFTDPVYLAGAAVDRYTAFGPTIGTAFNATLLSYRSECQVAFNIDTAAVTDPDLFTDCMRAGFDEVLGRSV